MKDIWIIGVGQFGLHAARNLARQFPRTRLIMVDPVEDHLLRAGGPNRSLVIADGVEYAVRHLSCPENGPEWIVPALPIHLAAQWCLRRQRPRLRRWPLPRTLDRHVPNPLRGRDGDLYASHATFTCPASCSEPADVCSVTGESRKKNMFEILADLDLPPFESFVIRSRQLGPGIGGYRPAELFALDKRIADRRGGILLSTACRCHGVVTGLRRE